LFPGFQRHFLKREKIVWQILKFAERLSNLVSTEGEKKFIDRCKGQSRFHFSMLVILQTDPYTL